MFLRLKGILHSKIFKHREAIQMKWSSVSIQR